MKKRIVCVMLAGMLMSVSLSACAGKTVDSVGGENTEVSEVVAGTESTEENNAIADTEVGATEVEDAAEAELCKSLQEVIGNKDLNELAEFMVYPSYIAVGEGVIVENEEQLLAMDAAEVLTDALVAAVKNADADALDITERGFFVGAPSGKPGVTFGYDAEGNLGITGINY